MKLMNLPGLLAAIVLSSAFAGSANAQTLQIDPMYVGGTATFEVQNGSPNAAAVICYSMNGIGPFTLSNGITLDLSLPIKNLSPFALNSLGNGTLGPFPLPSNAAVGLQVWFQGVQLDMWANPIYSVTNMVPITVQAAPNNPPTAVDDNASTRESVTVTIDVMANDGDIDGDGISLFSVSTPANGSAVINGGVIDYTPATSFSGTDAFTYQLEDSWGDQDTATVTVTVLANNAPVAADDNASVNENSVVLINVLFNDNDPDGDPISIVSVNTPTSGTTLIVSGQIEYTPLAGYAGSDSFTYVIEDAFAAQATATVIVDVVAAPGSLVSWGDDGPGRISDTPTTNDFTQVSAGGVHSVALRSDGSLVSWGDDLYDGLVLDTPTTNDFTQVSAGSACSVALRLDGSLVSWGRDYSNQILDTPTTNDFTQVSAGGGHSVALKSDGSLVSWGNDSHGQVSNTPTTNDFTQVSASSHSVALKSDGTLVSWGNDGHGQVSNTPTTNDFTQVSAGGAHSVALRSDGSLVSWGYDDAGQVSQTPSGNDFIDVAAGLYHSIALKSDGSLVSWGYDYTNQVSDTPTTNGFTQVSAGGEHSVAITL